MSDLRVAVRVGATVEGTVGTSVGRVTRQLDKLRKVNEQIDAVRARRAARRDQLLGATALGAAVLGPIAGATRAAIRFESVMADVRKVVDFDTPEQFAQMGQDVLNLSQRIPVAASGIGDIVAAAGQAGIAREELTRFAEDAAKVAVAFDISGAEAGGRLTGLRSIFKLNQDGVMRLAGSYNHLSNNMDATAPAMLNVAERTGSVARQFGLTGEQTGALAATFLALKTPPEIAGTAINAMLVRLSTAPQQSQAFQDALDELGFSAEDLKDAIANDAQGALNDFLGAVDKAEDKQAILFALFGQEYVDDITKLAGSLDIYRNAQGLAADQTAALTSIEEEYAARAGTTANQLQLLANQANVLGVNIGSVLLPSVNSAVGVIGSLVSKGAALAQEYPGVTRVVIGLVGGLVALRVASVFGGYGATFLAEGWLVGRRALIRAGIGAGFLGRSLWAVSIGAVPRAIAGSRALALSMWRTRLGTVGLGSALSGLSIRALPRAILGLRIFRLALIGTGIGAAVVAIGMGAALIMRYWEPIKAFFAGFGRGFAAAFKPLEPVFGWFGEVLGWIGRAFSALSEPINATDQQLAGFASTGEKVGNFIGNAFRLALLPVTTLIKGVGTALKWLGVLDDTEVEAGIKATEEPARPRRRGAVVGAAAAAGIGIGAAAPIAAAPVTEPPPAFPAAEEAPAYPTPDVEPAPATPSFAPAQQAGAPGAAATGVSLVFYQTFNFEGVGPDVRDEVAREMEIIMRRAAFEAGVGDQDDVF